ncbi:hypothetical protein A2U01_0110523, partial [Trifolium medium]|nr:hypothetical protein [Trifolium medium]
PVKAASVEASQFPLLQPPKPDDSAPEFCLSDDINTCETLWERL